MDGQFEVDLHWQPFELNPQMPVEGQNLREHLSQKYGASVEQSRGIRSRLTELGESLDFQFDYFDGMRMANTFRAHQLLHWAAEKGLQTELEMALFEAFFSRREDLGEMSMLVTCAKRAGLPGDEAAAVMEDERYATVVREAQKSWVEREIHAVPTFVFNDQYMVSGAQEAETLVRFFGKLQARLQSA